MEQSSGANKKIYQTQMGFFNLAILNRDMVKRIKSVSLLILHLAYPMVNIYMYLAKPAAYFGKCYAAGGAVEIVRVELNENEHTFVNNNILHTR